jgi:hypothetical protein
MKAHDMAILIAAAVISLDDAGGIHFLTRA